MRQREYAVHGKEYAVGQNLKDICSLSDGTGGGLKAQYADGGLRDNELSWTEKMKNDVCRRGHSSAARLCVTSFNEGVYGEL